MTEETKRPIKIQAWVYSEGYCCQYGYLMLCRARGETPKSMAEFSGVSKRVIWTKYRDIEDGLLTCAGRKDCMKPVIEEIRGVPLK